jgi:hypothetical protein
VAVMAPVVIDSIIWNATRLLMAAALIGAIAAIIYFKTKAERG